MKSTLLILIALAGCNGATNDAPAPNEPATAAPIKAPLAPIAAHLENAGSCMGAKCTMHFAQLTTGNADTFSWSVCTEPADGCVARTGKLSSSAVNQMRALAAQLEREQLQPRYGEPEGNDGPTYVIVLHKADGSVSEHVVDPFHVDGLPEPLKQASALLDGASNSMSECKASELIIPNTNCSELRKHEPPQGRRP